MLSRVCCRGEGGSPSRRGQGNVASICATIWVQGESDANPHDAALYTDALGDMLDTMRKDIGAPDLPVLIGVNIHFGDMKKVSPNMQLIVDGKRR